MKTVKAPRTVEVKVLVPYALLTVLTVSVAVFIAGYFTAINMHTDARASVVSDLQVITSKAAQK